MAGAPCWAEVEVAVEVAVEDGSAGAGCAEAWARDAMLPSKAVHWLIMRPQKRSLCCETRSEMDSRTREMERMPKVWSVNEWSHWAHLFAALWR